MLAAYKGELLGCVSMRKRDLTEEGKTWAGDVTEVPEEFATPLREIIRDVNWTGGAELEMVRDPEGQRWLLEWNPRFPAWVHGATIAGCNLARHAGRSCHRHSGRENDRAVGRVHARRPRSAGARTLSAPPLPEPYAGGIGHSMKHPSGMPALAERLHKLHPHLMSANGTNGTRLIETKWRRQRSRRRSCTISRRTITIDCRRRRSSFIEHHGRGSVRSRLDARAQPQHAGDEGRQRLQHQDESRRAAHQARARFRLLCGSDQPAGSAEGARDRVQARAGDPERTRQMVAGRPVAERAVTRRLLRFDRGSQSRDRGRSKRRTASRKSSAFVCALRTSSRASAFRSIRPKNFAR